MPSSIKTSWTPTSKPSTTSTVRQRTPAASASSLRSSVNAVGAYPHERQVRESDAPCPGNVYGASKAFGKSLGAYFAYGEKLSNISIRIGAVGGLEQPSANTHPSVQIDLHHPPQPVPSAGPVRRSTGYPVCRGAWSFGQPAQLAQPGGDDQPAGLSSGRRRIQRSSTEWLNVVTERWIPPSGEAGRSSAWSTCMRCPAARVTQVRACAASWMRRLRTSTRWKTAEPPPSCWRTSSMRPSPGMPFLRILSPRLRGPRMPSARRQRCR